MMPEFSINHKFRPGDKVRDHQNREYTVVMVWKVQYNDFSDEYKIVYKTQPENKDVVFPDYYIGEDDLSPVPQKFTVELEARYNVGDKVFHLPSLQPFVVTKVYVSSYASGSAVIEYNLEGRNGEVTGAREGGLSPYKEDDDGFTGPSD